MSEIYVYCSTAENGGGTISILGTTSAASIIDARYIAMRAVVDEAPVGYGWVQHSADVNAITENVIDMVKNDPDLRARFLDALKPATFADWDNAPKWANWYAADANGCGYYYEYKPRKYIALNEWDSSGGRSIDAGASDNLTNWRETLEHRP